MSYHLEVHNNRILEKVSIFDVQIDLISLKELLEETKIIIRANHKAIISNVNIHGLNLAYEQRDFHSLLNQSDLVFCDGFGVKVGAWILGKEVGERITYADWILDLAELSKRERFSLFLLGARPRVAEKAAARLSSAHPGLQVVGTQHGYFDKTHGSAENEAVVEMINHARPNILIVGFGMPQQERWIHENYTQLEVNVFLPAGAALDYAAGEVQRAPRWMTDHGLEWLGRLIIEPRRLWKRYLIGIPLFFWRVLKERIRGTGA